ncbi:MAG TPA: hypothetical protein VF742_03890 [Terracidiphilus sp.]
MGKSRTVGVRVITGCWRPLVSSFTRLTTNASSWVSVMVPVSGMEQIGPPSAQTLDQGLGEGAILPSISAGPSRPVEEANATTPFSAEANSLMTLLMSRRASPRREPFSIAPAAWQVSRKSTALPASDLSAFLRRPFQSSEVALY